MFDIGIGELLVIAVVALIVFGPDRLPRAAADGARWLRELRSLAASARRDLVDSAGPEVAETVQAVRDMGGLRPERLLDAVLNDAPPHPEPPRPERDPGSAG